MFSRVFRRHSLVKRDKPSLATTAANVATQEPSALDEERVRRRNTWNAFPSEIVISDDFFSPTRRRAGTTNGDDDGSDDDDDDDHGDDRVVEEDEHRSTRTADTFLQLSVSNDRTFEGNILPSMHDNLVVRRDDEDFPTTPIDGVSELIYQPHMMKGLAFPASEEEGDNDDVVGALRRNSQEVGLRRQQRCNDALIYEPDTPTSKDMTIATDETILGDSAAAIVYDMHASSVQQPTSAQESATMLQQHHLHRKIESSCLVTFQRKIDKHMIETTLHARIEGKDEDTMADLVRRLQKSAGVLTFGKKDLKRITKGSRQIVFLLPQINKATFSKDEFGEMKISDVMQLTRARPIVVEVKLEKTVLGEQLEIF